MKTLSGLPLAWHFSRVRCWASRYTNCSIWWMLATVGIMSIQTLQRANRRETIAVTHAKIICLPKICPHQSIG
jgi:hypothetical protein